MPYEPSQEDRFTVGLWCTQYAGREVFGREVRPPLDPIHNIRQLAKLGAWGFNFHDDDLVPFGSSAAETERILREAKQVMDGEGIVNSMVTCNMFEQPVFKDGALTSNDPSVRAYARQKGMRAIDMGAELGATVYVMWGGREGTCSCRAWVTCSASSPPSIQPSSRSWASTRRSSTHAWPA
jgi:xylose isomerase